MSRTPEYMQLVKACFDGQNVINRHIPAHGLIVYIVGQIVEDFLTAFLGNLTGKVREVFIFSGIAFFDSCFGFIEIIAIFKKLRAQLAMFGNVGGLV